MNKSLRIIYAGTPDFAVAALQALIDSGYEVVAVYTQPDRPAGRGREMKASPVKQKALEYAIPVFQPLSLSSEKAIRELKSLKPDLMIVAAYGLLLPAAVLEIPRLGCINIHASLLPRWRGAAPIQRAILAGDRVTGITIMQMDAGLDTGDMIARAECKITEDETGSSLHDKLMQLGAGTLLAVLSEIVRQGNDGHGLRRTRQNNDEASYAPKLNRAEAKINWSQPAVDIQRSVRAYNAWPVAYCCWEKNGKPVNLRVWQAQVIKNAEDAAGHPPGMVIAESAKGIDVVTGDGLLRITELQAEGKRKMQSGDFVNANSLLGKILQ